jgi:hypothetical protein
MHATCERLLDGTENKSEKDQANKDAENREKTW